MNTQETTHQVRVHIEGHRVDLPSPITGEAFYRAAHVPEGEILYREVQGDREDEPVHRHATEIILREDEHFYVDQPHKPEHVIRVNTRRKTVEGKKISFEKVVKLAYPAGPPTPETVYTVTYSFGPPKNPEGSMVKGQTVKIKDEMVFDVTETSRS